MSNTKLTFSRHARVRQEQRNITDSSVNDVIEFGEKTDFKESTIYTDQNINVVFDTDSCTVITVKKNTRNTKFKLSEHTKQKEKSLHYEVNKKNNYHAMCELAELYLEGELGEKDIWKAYNLFERAAKMGSSHAMCKISQLYESADLGTPNQELADMWMKKAADRNNVYALAFVGQKLLLKYLEKYPVESNIFRPSAPKKEILDYLNRAADKGSSRGIWQLGNIYEEGLLGEKKLSKAIEFYVKAAKTGSPSSIDALNDMTLESKFCAKELEEILDNLSPLLTNTSIGMAFQIGKQQLIGEIGYNPVRGLKMVEQAALKQYDQAMDVLAQCYCRGIACTSNLKLAHYWFIKLHELYNVSAEGGNVISLWKLGKLYLNGDVENIDLEKAESCFKEAIEKSSRPNWIYDLGLLYFKGRLGDKPTTVGSHLIAQAIKIWQFQVEQGNTKAYFHIGNAYLSIHSYKNAVYWLSNSSNDDIDSQLYLAKIYLDDLFPEKNISLGLNILESIILKHSIHPKVAFKAVKFKINNQTISWLQKIANNITKPISTKNSNQHTFQTFVITTLANVYETGKLGKINYDLASKYYNQLLVDFGSIAAGNKLVLIQHLPMEYYDTVKNWALQIPTLLETDTIDFRNFIDCVLVLSKIYQKGSILPHDVKKATKWLYLASYFICNNEEAKDIECDLENLPNLDFNQKEQIVSELLQTTQNIKINSPKHYKLMSRILGDIFYDNKIINQNIGKAIYWYNESSLKNNSRASLALAKIYQYDKQDIDTSIKWYVLSTQQGNKDALKALTAIVKDQHLDNLSPFLNRYKHQSVIKESDVMNIKPLKNLESYPKTKQEMYELGKSYLNSENQQINVLNAAFWFRKAMHKGSIDAAIELFSMYKSGILGSNLIPVADNLCLDILNMCYTRLKESTTLDHQDTSSVLSLLNNVCLVLKIGNINTSIELNQSIETVISQSHDADNETLKDIILKLELLNLELCLNMLDSTASSVLDTVKSQ